MNRFFLKIKRFVVKNWPVILILISFVLASRTLFRHNYYFNMHDDLQMMRQLQLEKCFLDLQIPCRWVPDMGYGFGLPLFNYYPQLPYLFGQALRLIGFAFNDVAKLTFAFGIMASGFSMYVLSKEFFGKTGGVLSAIFYIWAPYRALDVYVRGAMNESWAWIWFPLILWASYKLINSNKSKNSGVFEKSYLMALSLSTAGLLLTHNLMVLIFAPVVLVWVFFWLIKTKSTGKIIHLFYSGILALGLSAFFTLPAVLEQKYVHISTLTADYFQYFAHFATFNQLFFSRFWGDGPSVFGPVDYMAFPIGQVHWILILIITALLAFKIYKFKKINSTDFLIIFGVVIGTASAFMTHERSTFIWQLIPKLEFVQFPWRFLAVTVFAYSFAIGSVFYLLKNLKFSQKIFSGAYILVGLTILVITFNWNFFTPVHSGPVTDEQKFGGESWRIQTQAGILDYLPIEAKDDPEFAAERLVDVVSGEAVVTDEKKGTNWAEFKINIESEEAQIRVNIFKYPDWRAFAGGNEVTVFVDEEEEFGRMYLRLPKGSHDVSLKLYNTPLRKTSNTISLIAWAGLITFLISKRKVLQFKRG
jgi:hypothetical protein